MEDEDSFEDFVELKLSKPEVVIPPRLIDLTGFKSKQKIISQCRSNHVLYCHDLSDMTIVFFTNQRVRTVLLQNLTRCRIVCMDSLDLKTGKLWLENAVDCVFLFDQVDIAELNATNVSGSSFCFSNSEGSLLDEHVFRFQACANNRIVKVEIVRGTDPNVNPELPISRETFEHKLVGEHSGEGRFGRQGKGFFLEPQKIQNTPMSSVVQMYSDHEIPSNDVLRDLYAAELAEFRDPIHQVRKQVEWREKQQRKLFYDFQGSSNCGHDHRCAWIRCRVCWRGNQLFSVSP
jgi:hypothetical protein